MLILPLNNNNLPCCKEIVIKQQEGKEIVGVLAGQLYQWIQGLNCNLMTVELQLKDC